MLHSLEALGMMYWYGGLCPVWMTMKSTREDCTRTTSQTARSACVAWPWPIFHTLMLKLYYRYEYTKPCMINCTWGLKTTMTSGEWTCLISFATALLTCWNGEGAKNSKWKYMSPAGYEPTHRQFTTGKSQRLRPLGHEGLMMISGLMSYKIMG